MNLIAIGLDEERKLGIKVGDVFRNTVPHRSNESDTNNSSGSKTEEPRVRSTQHQTSDTVFISYLVTSVD